MLEIKDLSKRYGDVVALDGATFTATPGRIVGFLGPNGAGKTTTMRCIFGLARPDRGRDALARRSRSTAMTRLRFGYMPEQRGLYPRMRVGEQMSYFAQHHGMSAPRRGHGHDRVARAPRARRSREGQAGGRCRTATSSASSSARRSSTTRSCSSSTSRSRASTRSASRRCPRSSGSERRPASASSSRATSSTSSRTSARTS